MSEASEQRIWLSPPSDKAEEGSVSKGKRASTTYRSIESCAEFLGNLGIQEPYRWVAGIEGAKDRQLHIPNRYDRTWGPCMTDSMQLEGTYQKGDNTAELLRPFFENVFDQCGVQRAPLQR